MIVADPDLGLKIGSINGLADLEFGLKMGSGIGTVKSEFHGLMTLK